MAAASKWRLGIKFMLLSACGSFQRLQRRPRVRAMQRDAETIGQTREHQEISRPQPAVTWASIALEPANKAYETRIFGPDQVKIQGRLVGLMRKY